MGNANTHVGTDHHLRRKSKGDGAAGANQHSQSSHALGHSSHYDDAMIGPVDITAGVHHRSKDRRPSSPGRAAGMAGFLPHRPRATTEVSRRPPKHEKQHHNSSGSDSTVPPAAKTPPIAGQLSKDAGMPQELMAAAGKGEKKMPTIFKYNGATAKEVYVSGTFNNWGKLPMNRSTKDFVAIVDLGEGDHEYKFVVDGEWVNDKGTELKDGNNFIRVQKEDFNAYDALDMDSKAVTQAMDKKRAAQHGFAGGMGGPSYPHAEFGQETPARAVFAHRSGPPILPPHLLQVILNKDTPLSCEPTLLPEPNHVMLNHLYALSIKDGVMVMSSTQRYRKKYVTTLLYKPMGARKTDVPTA